MPEFIKNISFAELAIYISGSVIWFALICWLFEEELEAKRQERFGRREVRCNEK